MKGIYPALLFFAVCAMAYAVDPVSLSVATPASAAGKKASFNAPPLELTLQPPDGADILLQAPDPDNWITFDTLRVGVFPAADAPANIQALVQVNDWENSLFQLFRKDYLVPGRTNILDIPVGPTASGWTPLGHPGGWHRRTFHRPERVRIAFFATGAAGTAALEITEAVGIPADDTAPPFIRYVRPTEASRAETPVDGRFELRFEIPDRYANPFDPDEIAVDAEIAAPSGTLSIPCFYYQDCLRLPTATGDSILPQGRPEWRLRFSPSEEGTHTIALIARDRFGETRLPDAAAFTAVPSTGMRTVHVSKRDPRFFEDDGGAPYFPIGHNIRSPFDVRSDEQFPTHFRHPEGTTSYGRRFRQMAAHGMNIAEIWASAWCMGLEWSALYPGYHGIGQFNLRNAWERDRVFEMAAESGIRINLVLNNHGRLADGRYNPEWPFNPYNAATQPGGWFMNARDWFTKERAIAQYEKQLRYEIARYAWNANLFAWELWSELDLSCGQNPHTDPEVHEWHRRVAAYLHEHDPKRHMVTTHTSGNFNRMVPALAAVEGLDHICVDAYHSNPSPLHICELMHGTKQAPHLKDRAVLITEFGGSAMAASVRHLRRELHSALWDSLPSGLAGAPMLWWWHVVEEYDFYPIYGAFAKFCSGEPLPDPERIPTPNPVSLTHPKGAPADSPPVVAQLAAGPAGGYAWIHVTGDAYEELDPAADSPRAGYRLNIPIKAPDTTVYTFEFWDTVRGEPIRLQDIAVRNGRLDVSIPPFVRDIALKFRRTRESAL